MEFLNYTNQDKWDLEKLCMASLSCESKTRGMLYLDLVDGKHIFHKFDEARQICGGLQFDVRVQEEKKRLSQALQRLRKRKLVNLYVNYRNESIWELTTKGAEAAAFAKFAPKMQMEQPQDPEVNDY